MSDVVQALPLHPIIVHATVVLIPLFMIWVIVGTVRPRFRPPGVWLPCISTALLVLTGVTSASGQGLELRVEETDLIARHTALGDLLTPLMFVFTVSMWVAYLMVRRDADNYSAVLRVVSVLIAIGALGIMVEVFIIGHSGATAVWSTEP